jgi:hypothetical protein
MAKLLAAPTKNAIQKTLSAQLASSASVGDPISFDDVDGIANLPGVLVIRRVDGNGTATPDFREYIEYSGTSGTTVLITTRNLDGSNAALTHPAGSIVEFIPDVTWADRMYDALATLVDVNDISTINSSIVTSSGAVTLYNKLLTGATLSGPTINGVIAGSATFTGELAFNGDVSLKRRKTPIYDNGTAGPSLAIDLNNGETQRLTLTTNATVSLVNMESGDYLSLYVIQASGGSKSLILAQSGGSIKYSGGASLPGISTTSNAVDLLGIRAFNASTTHVVATVTNLS